MACFFQKLTLKTALNAIMFNMRQQCTSKLGVIQLRHISVESQIQFGIQLLEPRPLINYLGKMCYVS